MQSCDEVTVGLVALRSGYGRLARFEGWGRLGRFGSYGGYRHTLSVLCYVNKCLHTVPKCAVLYAWLLNISTHATLGPHRSTEYWNAGKCTASLYHSSSLLTAASVSR